MADALKQRGIAFDHVDASDGVGGLWRNGVYQGVHIVSSKKSTGYTDYPMPAHYPDFPSSSQMLRYLESFAHDRGLTDTPRGCAARWSAPYRSPTKAGR